ncbi:hypothetical protein [Streptomyces telluris]|uniref:Uncharacterized protein n=1 Tax=Streptomyces telluris TaxID=2720021 RepID=A0A9X2LLX1_9ACTN|nr:hypothetical protein [Streptomyces telluris]MCQ8773657.1 hypothetical protein [Streptomyces telluris]NJP80860.1 hypothetical protein [Streptomyces telluris]
MDAAGEVDGSASGFQPVSFPANRRKEPFFSCSVQKARCWTSVAAARAWTPPSAVPGAEAAGLPAGVAADTWAMGRAAARPAVASAGVTTCLRNGFSVHLRVRVVMPGP